MSAETWVVPQGPILGPLRIKKAADVFGFLGLITNFCMADYATFTIEDLDLEEFFSNRNVYSNSKNK